MSIYLKSLTVTSIAGAAMVSIGNPFMANIFWSVSNPFLAYHNLKIGQKEQSLLFCVFTILAWFGVLYSLLR